MLREPDKPLCGNCLREDGMRLKKKIWRCVWCGEDVVEKAVIIEGKVKGVKAGVKA
jgi:ribosomal protein L37AE/L43A